ncbi:hypothetical protein IP84_12565 [beta proteobacterium AAP99]|nr:hypothetical protein IP84_12565 [beta proteobacterium AAP99]
MRAIVLMAALLWHGQAVAWNRTGHWITAVVAHDALRQNDPAAFAAAVALLRQHPSAEDWLSWKTEFPQLDDSLILFMMASVFADDARRGKFESLDRPDWHYINYAIEPGKTTADIASSRALTGRLPDALTDNLALLRDGARPEAERALALSWVLHLVGDLHQPLHTTGLVNADFPTGDRGGNDVFVRDPQRAEFAVRLHALWDDAVGGPTRDMPRVVALAREWAASRAGALSPSSAADWLAESYRASVELGYRNGTLRYALLADVLPPPPEQSATAGAPSAQPGAPMTGPQPLRGTFAPPLPEGYVQAMRSFSEARVVQAGRRMAELLRQVSAGR